MTMKKDNIIIASILIIGIVIIVSMLWILAAREEERVRASRQEYAECASRTTDKEWCFEQIFGIDVDLGN